MLVLATINLKMEKFSVGENVFHRENDLIYLTRVISAEENRGGIDLKLLVLKCCNSGSSLEGDGFNFYSDGAGSFYGVKSVRREYPLEDICEVSKKHLNKMRGYN
jgi:hypothetical protein